MQKLIQESPKVAESFFNMTRSIKEFSPMDEKTNELILIGIFTAHGAMRGLVTHIERARNEGASKEEILASILLALPVVGITTTNLAIETALQFLDKDCNANHRP